MRFRILFSSLFVLMLGVVWTSCKNNNNDKTPAKTYALSGTASGTQERPMPVTGTTATATLTGTYNAGDSVLTYTITWSGLTADVAAMHFHAPASVEESASPIIAITGFTPATEGTVSGTATLTADQASQLLYGKWYYNIHTATYPGGEIRAQVVTTEN